jgi:hypothetical protein
MARKKRKPKTQVRGSQIFYGLCAVIYGLYLLSYGYGWTELRFQMHEDATVTDMLSEYVGCTVINLVVILFALITRRGRLLTAMLFLQSALIFITAYAMRMDAEAWLASTRVMTWWDQNPKLGSDVFLWCGGAFLVISAILTPALSSLKPTPKPKYADQWLSPDVEEASTETSYEPPVHEDAAGDDPPVAEDPIFSGDLADEPA